MSEESDESRIKIEDLPQEEQELTADEARDVQGGEGRTRLIIGEDQGVFGSGGGPHVKGNPIMGDDDPVP